MPKIVSAKTIVTSPGRNFITLKIETDEGVYGLGDATLNGRELAVESYLTDHVIPCLIGRDAHRIEEFEHLEWGVAQARRAWVEAGSVINTRSRADLLTYVRRNDRRTVRA